MANNIHCVLLIAGLCHYRKDQNDSNDVMGNAIRFVNWSHIIRSVGLDTPEHKCRHLTFTGAPHHMILGVPEQVKHFWLSTSTAIHNLVEVFQWHSFCSGSDLVGGVLS